MRFYVASVALLRSCHSVFVSCWAEPVPPQRQPFGRGPEGAVPGAGDQQRRSPREAIQSRLPIRSALRSVRSGCTPSARAPQQRERKLMNKNLLKSETETLSCHLRRDRSCQCVHGKCCWKDVGQDVSLCKGGWRGLFFTFFSSFSVVHGGPCTLCHSVETPWRGSRLGCRDIYSRRRDLNDRCAFPHSPGGRRSEVQVWAASFSPEAASWHVDGVLSLCPHGVVPLCVSVS